MGVSTNALIYYGFDFFNAEDDEPTEHMEKFLGEGEFNDEDGEYYDLTKDNPDIEIDYHCSNDYRIWFIAFKPSVTTVYRGYPKEIDASQFYQDLTSADEKIKEFCEKHQIPWHQPKWYLASYWG